MTWQNIPDFTSSNLASAKYNAESMILEVVFKSGGVYQYYDVPANVIEEFGIAESKGGFLAHRIKGHYRYSKV